MSRGPSWGDGDLPIEPIERYLAYLTDIERSPNTVRAYAHDLKDWFVFLGARGLDWREVRLEDIGEFVAWLRLPPTGRDGGGSRCCRRQVLCVRGDGEPEASAISAFYQHAARHGVDLGELLITWGPAGRRGGWKPFLHHLSKGQPVARRAIALKTSRKLPRVLTAGEVQSVLDACGRCGTGFCSRCFMTLGCGSGRRSGTWSGGCAAEPASFRPALVSPHGGHASAARRRSDRGGVHDPRSRFDQHNTGDLWEGSGMHLTSEDARRALEEAGWFTGR